jgi:hypothetical protein
MTKIQPNLKANTILITLRVKSRAINLVSNNASTTMWYLMFLKFKI